MSVSSLIRVEHVRYEKRFEERAADIELCRLEY